ncbi:MAG: sortase, partial [Caulobacterales bacterium]
VRSYKVTGQEVVLWNRSGIDPHATGETLALVTCWPVEAMGKGPHRLVVFAEAIKDAPGNGAAIAAR